MIESHSTKFEYEVEQSWYLYGALILTPIILDLKFVSAVPYQNRSIDDLFFGSRFELQSRAQVRLFFHKFFAYSSLLSKPDIDCRNVFCIYLCAPCSTEYRANWHERAAFQRSSFGRSRSGGRLLAMT